jgi:hypothetical protein
MISEDDKIKLFSITIILDILLLSIMKLSKLNIFDSWFVYVILISHLLFYGSLTLYNKKVLDILHVVIFAALGTSIFLSNIYLLLTCLLLLIMIQILWLIESRCILNESGEIWGYGDIIQVGTIIWTVLLSLKIFYRLRKSQCTNLK